MADISYLEAWRMWFGDVQVNQHTIHGWSILALGRAGKVVSFLAGLTIILDIAGHDRLTSAAAWLRRERDRADLPLFVLLLSGWWFALAALAPDWRAPNWVVEVLVMMAVGLTGTVAGAYATVFVWLGARRLTGWGLAKLAGWLEHPQAVHFRVLSLAALVIGFHFDMLSS